MAAPYSSPLPPTSQGMKFILVTGGVCSSVGKGVMTSAVGALLYSSGYHVSVTKIDPYINIDAGLMSPLEHGEVFVLDDGGEVDLDLGNYERWIPLRLTRQNNITTGKVYDRLLHKEREGTYLGKTVQIVPHFVDEAVQLIRENGRLSHGSGESPLMADICLIELGGTVGDLESAPFLEAMRRLRFASGPSKFCHIHITYLPELGGVQKTKPTQHGCHALLSSGHIPDFLACRSASPLNETVRRKLTEQCGVIEEHILSFHDIPILYEAPLTISNSGMIDRILARLELPSPSTYIRPPPDISLVPSLSDYRHYIDTLSSENPSVRIAFVGKYTAGGKDAYFSVLQAFEHCCIALKVSLEFEWIDSELLTSEDPSLVASTKATLERCDGIFVAGGFGSRGVEGKILAIEYARTHNIPFFGVCLGMQLAIVETLRHVAGLPTAHSSEFDPNTSHQVVKIMKCDQTQLGATMHLGGRDLFLRDTEKSHMRRIYANQPWIRERHRHRYEFNMDYAVKLEASGLHITAMTDPAMGPECRVEAVELPLHRFFLAVQFHPEFLSSPQSPSPPYLAFLEATAKKSYNWSKTCPSWRLSSSEKHRDS